MKNGALFHISPLSCRELSLTEQLAAKQLDRISTWSKQKFYQ